MSDRPEYRIFNDTYLHKLIYQGKTTVCKNNYNKAISQFGMGTVRNR